MSDASIWICPGCSRKFRLPAGKKPPRQCQTCQQAAPSPPPAPVIDESSFLADLAAVAPPPVPTPTPTPTPADPGPAPGFVRIIPAETVQEENLKTAIRREKTRRRLIVGGIVATAAGLLIGLGLFVSREFSGPYRMSESEIYSLALDHMTRAAEGELTVEFPGDHRVERDVALVQGKWLSLIHGRMAFSEESGSRLEVPWSAIVSVDHANRAIAFEFKAAENKAGYRSEWLTQAFEDRSSQPPLTQMLTSALHHGKEPRKADVDNADR